MARSRLPSERTHAEREEGGREGGRAAVGFGWLVGWLVGGGACERDQLHLLMAAHEAMGMGGEERRGGRA